MNCPNCNQPCQEGATFCPSCGSPLPSTAPPTVPPPPSPHYMPPSQKLRSSSGLAKASMILGISGLLLLGLAVVLVFLLVSRLADILGDARYLAQDEIMRYLEEYFATTRSGEYQALSMGILLSGILSVLSGLVGLILGVVGLSQESSRPTESGRTQSIVGIATGSVPLLLCTCCLAYYLVLAVGGGIAS